MHTAKGLYVLYIPSKVSPGRVAIDEFKNFPQLSFDQSIASTIYSCDEVLHYVYGKVAACWASTVGPVH